MTHKPPQGIYARVRELRSKLGDLLADEDLTDEKLREASEGLLPNIYDALAAPDPRKGLAALVAKWKATADHIKAESELHDTLATATYATLRGCADELEQRLAEMRGAKR